jgi:hypothetical protein
VGQVGLVGLVRQVGRVGQVERVGQVGQMQASVVSATRPTYAGLFAANRSIWTFSKLIRD